MAAVWGRSTLSDCIEDAQKDARTGLLPDTYATSVYVPIGKSNHTLITLALLQLPLDTFKLTLMCRCQAFVTVTD